MVKIKNILKEITDPMSGYSILELGIIEKVITKGKELVVRVNLPRYSHVVRDYMITEIKRKLIAIPHIERVVVEVTSKVIKYPFI
ncbi:MAG: iron-sulfur cluster assembly protein [Candidatus Nanoarchaeia archaeon]